MTDLLSKWRFGKAYSERARLSSENRISDIDIAAAFLGNNFFYFGVIITVDCIGMDKVRRHAIQERMRQQPTLADHKKIGHGWVAGELVIQHFLQ